MYRETFWDLRNHVRTVSQLLNLGGGQQVNLGGQSLWPLPQRKTALEHFTTFYIWRSRGKTTALKHFTDVLQMF